MDSNRGDEAVLNVRTLGKSGLRVSNVGIGSAGLSGLHGDMDEKEAKAAIVYAIGKGANFIDTAPYYNDRRAEVLLGELLGNFKREELIIATKIGRYMNLKETTEQFDYSAGTTKKSILDSLRLMKTSYIDLIQIHDVEFAPSLKVLKEETIPCLVELKNQGLVKSIGVTGYSTRHVRKVVETCINDVDVVMSYMRHNLFDTSLANDLQFYKDHNVGVINASPFAIGLLTNGGNIPEWNPASDEVKAACRVAANHCDDNHIDIARLALRHSIEADGITMTVFSSRKVKTMMNNITCAGLPLSDREGQMIKYLRKHVMSHIQNKHWEERLNKYHTYWDLTMEPMRERTNMPSTG